ncbi:IGLL5 protein, partial [Polyodon spathula]|nr:IGLL5 protein [Polyodon spathula]
MISSTVLITALVLRLTGLDALVLKQQKSLSVSPRHTAKISCVMTGGSVSSWTISWYQQKSGSVPRYLLYGISHASGVPDRYTGSEDSSSNMQQSGSGNRKYQAHQCRGVLDHQGAIVCLFKNIRGRLLWAAARPAVFTAPFDTFGDGTKLDVAQSASPPSLTLLPPSGEEQSTRSKATLVCLAQGFYPGSVTVTWMVDGQPKTGSEVQTSELEQLPDGYFQLSSFLSLPASQWTSGKTYSCQLRHEALSSPLEKNVRSSDCI